MNRALVVKLRSTSVRLIQRREARNRAFLNDLIGFAGTVILK